MRQHKLALCAKDYLAWFEKQTLHAIQRDKLFELDAKVLVAVSGGKDSLALWDVLDKLGFECDGLYIGLGIDEGQGYSNRSRALAQQFADQADLKLIVVEVQETQGASIPEAAQLTPRGAGKPCSLCGLTRRHIMNRAALEGEYDVLVTGHNLDDEAATLMGNTMNWLVGYLDSQAPVLAGKPGFARKAKPFHRFYERETAAYAFLRGIEYIHQECPFSVDAKSIYYKKMLNGIETDRPGAKQGFYLSFLRAKDQISFNHSNEDIDPDRYCATCGQLTRGSQQCAFCSTWQQVRSRQTTKE